MDAEDRELRERLLSECIDRLNRGESIDIHRILAEHPGLGPDFIDQVEAFQGLVEDGRDNLPLGTLGDYRLLRRIGRGGMGVVYEAWQESMDRRVALKVLPGGLLADLKEVARFEREARIAGSLQHPNIVPVHGTGVDDNTPYYSMEFVEGETLAQVLVRNREAGRSPSPEECFRFAEAFAGVAEGLQHAHGKGIIHRDLKPSNLILDSQGRLRVLDFGLARLEGQESLTRSGDLLGTPLYMSPEQALARKVPLDHRTDIYSLGATLYELLAGRPPFQGKDYRDTLSQIITRDPEPPRRANPRVPRELETIVLKCLRKEPAGRYGTAEALGQDLRRFARGDPIEARPLAAWERWAHRIRREKRKLLTGILVLLLLGALGAAGFLYASEVRASRLNLYRTKVQASLKKLEEAQMTFIDPSALEFQGVAMAEFSQEAGRALVEEAIRDLGDAATLLPRLRDAWYYRGRALHYLGRFSEAISDLDRAIASDPNFLPPRLLKALAISNRGDQEGAEAELERARKDTRGEAAQVWLRIPQALLRPDWKEAEALFGKLIEMEERGIESYRDGLYDSRMGRGIARNHLQDSPGAIEDFAVARSRWPDLNEPAVCLGEAYYWAGQRERAAKVFVELYQRSSAPARAAISIAATYHGLKDCERGLAWVERIDDQVLQDRLRIGLLAGRGQVGEALEAANRLLQRNPDDSLALREMGRLLLIQGKSADAEKSLRHALAISPQDFEAVRSLGDALKAERKFKEAREEYGKILARSAADVVAHTALAGIDFEEGKFAEAEARVKASLEMNPYLYDSYILLAKLQARQGRVEEARRSLERAVPLATAITWDAAEANALAGWVYLDLELLGDAERCFRRTLELNPSHFRAREGLSTVLSKQVKVRGQGNEGQEKK